MLYLDISIGTQVRPVGDDVLHSVSASSIGTVIKFRKIGRDAKDFHATILWDNGTETFLNAMFFWKAVTVVDEVS